MNLSRVLSLSPPPPLQPPTVGPQARGCARTSCAPPRCDLLLFLPRLAPPDTSLPLLHRILLQRRVAVSPPTIPVPSPPASFPPFCRQPAQTLQSTTAPPPLCPSTSCSFSPFASLASSKHSGPSLTLAHELNTFSCTAASTTSSSVSFPALPPLPAPQPTLPHNVGT
jgi:hypothetical protein